MRDTGGTREGHGRDTGGMREGHRKDKAGTCEGHGGGGVMVGTQLRHGMVRHEFVKTHLCCLNELYCLNITCFLINKITQT